MRTARLTAITPSSALPISFSANSFRQPLFSALSILSRWISSPSSSTTATLLLRHGHFSKQLEHMRIGRNQREPGDDDGEESNDRHSEPTIVKRKSRRPGSQRLSHWRSPAFRLFAGLVAGAGADSAFAGRIAGHPLLATVGPRTHAGRHAFLHVFGRAGLGRTGTDIAFTRSARCRLGLRKRATDRQCENAGGCQDDFFHGRKSLD